MFDIQDPEDRQIRLILIAASSLVVVGLIGAAVTCAVLISLNFNPLNWME